MAANSLMGSVVAFEGEPDLVSTQLRLLPTSSQLLILPSVESFIKTGENNQCFNARDFIRQIHTAHVARNDAARAFLDGSTTDHKRLVFLNGGTLGLRILCVKKIMEYETNGNKAEAEAVFEDIVKHGVAGLDKHLFNLDSGKRGFGWPDTVDDDVNVEEDSITKAMRAADALDRQTAELQPPNDMGLSLASRPRSFSLPLYGFLDEFAESTPFYVFGVRPNDEESPTGDFKQSVSGTSTPSATMLTNSTQHTLETSRLGSSCPSPSIYPASCIGETYCSGADADHVNAVAGSPMSEAFSLRSSDHIVLGKASVLDVRLSLGRSSISRVKSLDRIYPVSPKLRDLGAHTRSWLDEPDTPWVLQHPNSAKWLSDDRSRRSSRMSIIERPRTIVVRPRLSSVQMRPVPTCKKRKKAKGSVNIAKPNYVDRGTDARQDVVNKLRHQPVLPPVEDLVIILIKGDSSDSLLESAFRAFKYRRYPPLSPSPTASDVDYNDGSLPGTPPLSLPKSVEKLRVPLKESDMPSFGADDYDPFAYTQPSRQLSKSSEPAARVTIIRPPTPAVTPPPTTVGENESKIHEFRVASDQTAVSVQNSLRSILGEYFPPDTEGYRQFQIPLLPEFDELWKPIFRESNPQKDDGNGTQILAIGSQNGVEKEYSQAITGRLEKVGRKLCDIVKTGRVDFRYLLANAMQAFTAQRLANQTDNPFTNSYLLATLIIPHLETYLTLHTDVRYLLLMYPPEHLATVLALQKLVGLDVIKVAQIVDSTSKDDSPFTHLRGALINSKSESKPSRTPFSTRTSSDVAVSKANYLLTSTASEKDIATFVSTVWNIAIEKPEVPVPDIVTGKAKRKASLRLKNGHEGERSQATRRRSPSPKPANKAPSSRGLAAPVTLLHEPSSPSVSLRAPSFAETVRTFRSIKSKRSQTKLRTKNAPQIDTEMSVDLDYIDDSDDDMDERRLMPVFMQKHCLQKPNSRKALKFLGLA